MNVPRIAIAGIAIESSTFSPHRAEDRDFHKRTGEELVAMYGACAEPGAQWVGVFHARALPGGPIRREVYEDYRRRICEGLRDAGTPAPLEGILLDIHGAMSVEGMDDAEGDLLTAIREVVGPDVMICAPMDLHGNVSPTLVENLDLLTFYRMAPHEDEWETKNRTARYLVRTLVSGDRPVRAWVPLPILLPGEKTSTRVEPAKSLYARINEIERRPGIIDAAIWVGYAWADEPRCHATVVVQGTDEHACALAAGELARAMWRVRDDFEFVGPPGTLDEAVDAALAVAGDRSRTPYLISDSGDNPGAGGTGDVTWTLEQLLARPELTGPGAPTTYAASIFDAGAIEWLRADRG